jgi:hypothetical protein
MMDLIKMILVMVHETWGIATTGCVPRDRNNQRAPATSPLSRHFFVMLTGDSQCLEAL